jgi:hypothetical protein
MLAGLNRWIANALFAIGICLVGVGIYLGLFAWLNVGITAGLQLLGTAGAFGAGLSVAGLALRFASAAHARSDSRRWWIQVLAVLVGYVAFGLAAEATSLLDRLGRR